MLKDYRFQMFSIIKASNYGTDKQTAYNKHFSKRMAVKANKWFSIINWILISEKKVNII